MSRQVYELETVLQGLIDEHAQLLKLTQTQLEAMKKMDLRAMDEAVRMQEAGRLRMAGLENRRRLLIQAIGRTHRMMQNPGLSDIAALYPASSAKLLKLREVLRVAIVELHSRNHVAQRLAGAVLGHLNTVVRLVAGAVEKAGLYNRSGVPQVSGRIGMMEAVG